MSDLIDIALDSQTDYEGWRRAARIALSASISPEHLFWRVKGSAPSLLASGTLPDNIEPITLTVPKSFMDISKRVICHRDTQRFARLYRILWRLQKTPRLLRQSSDLDIVWLTACNKAITRDRHKMHAFVRFRKTGMGRYRREQFAAWFEPTHFITELGSPFFMRRFPNMDWVIVTPEKTAIWDGHTLEFAAGGKREDIPAEDAVEDQWAVYFQSIFNPARVKIGAMMSEMPKKYWANMPETTAIPDMIAKARKRESNMIAAGGSTPNPLAATLKRRTS